MPLLSRLLKETDRFERIWGAVRRAAGAAAAFWGMPQLPCDGDSGRSACSSPCWASDRPANALIFVFSESVLGLPRMAPPGWWWAPASSVSAGWSPAVGSRPSGPAGDRWANPGRDRPRRHGYLQWLTRGRDRRSTSSPSSRRRCTARRSVRLALALFPTGIRAIVAGWMSVAARSRGGQRPGLFGILVTVLESFWSRRPWSRCRCLRSARCTPASRDHGDGARGLPRTERPAVEQQGGAQGHRHLRRHSADDVGQQVRRLDQARPGPSAARGAPPTARRSYLGRSSPGRRISTRLRTTAVGTATWPDG